MLEKIGFKENIKMKKILLMFLVLFIQANFFAQTRDSFFVGQWRGYAAESPGFDYLRLDKNGTGLKSFGKIVNEENTFIGEEVMILTNWYVEKDTLFIVPFKTPRTPSLIKYVISNKALEEFEAIEQSAISESLSEENHGKKKNRFIADKTKLIKDPENCISNFELFKKDSIDSKNQIVRYRGFENLLLYICKPYLDFGTSFQDPGYELIIPKRLDKFGIGYSEHGIEYTFTRNSKLEDYSSITIFYDFDDGRKNALMKSMQEEEGAVTKIDFEGKDMYLFKAQVGHFNGRIYYENPIFIQYTTSSSESEEHFRKCIASFRYSLR